MFWIDYYCSLETGIIWEYDSVSDEWCRGVVTFRMTKVKFINYYNFFFFIKLILFPFRLTLQREH